MAFGRARGIGKKIAAERKKKAAADAQTARRAEKQRQRKARQRARGGGSAAFDTAPEDEQDLFQKAFESIGSFSDFVSQNNQRFIDAQLGRVDPTRSLGILDTVQTGFENIATGQDPVIEAQRARAIAESSESFGRRGTGGSSAEVNEQLRIGGLFDEQQLSNRNAGLAGLLQTSSQRFGVETGAAGFNNLATGQELDFLQQGLENAGLEPALITALLNTLTAGTDEEIDFFPPEVPDVPRATGPTGIPDNSQDDSA